MAKLNQAEWRLCAELAEARVIELRELAEAAYAHDYAALIVSISHSSSTTDAKLRDAEKRLDDAMQKCMPEKYWWHGVKRPRSSTALDVEFTKTV